MYSDLTLYDLINTCRFSVEEKGIVTPAMPLENGCLIKLDVHYHSGESIPLGAIIRWAILYELFSMMEHSDKKNFETNKKNSILFVTEWLDDLMLLIWELHGEVYGNNVITNFVSWDGKELKNYPYVLKYCKHCFKELEERIPINSLHYNRRGEKDCSRKYKSSEDFKRNSAIISEAEKKLAAILEKIETNDQNTFHKKMGPGGIYGFSKEHIEKLNVQPREVILCEFNNVLKECREILASVADRWHKRLQGAWFYNNPDFDPIIEITNRDDDLYCPKNTSKKYHEFTHLLKTYGTEIEGVKSIFLCLYKANHSNRLDLVDFLRRLFYESNKYFYVSKIS